MDLNIQDKINGDTHSAAEFNLFKQAINSKADKTALIAETEARLLTEQHFEAGFQSKVNKIDYVMDLGNLQSEDSRLLNLIETLARDTEFPDLTDYLKVTDGDMRYLPVNYIFNQDFRYASLIGKPSIPDITNLVSKSELENKGYLTSIPAISYNSLTNLPVLFNGSYNTLSNKPDLGGYLLKADAATMYQLKGDYLTSIEWVDILNKPIMIEAYSKLESDSKYLPITYSFNQDFQYASLTDKPTTLSGFGIIDAVTEASLMNALGFKSDLTLIVNVKTGSYTLTSSDSGNMIQLNSNVPNNLTIPSNETVAFPVGSQIIIQQIGEGQTTVLASSGVTVNSVGNKTSINVRYSTATLIKTGIDVWSLIGDII